MLFKTTFPKNFQGKTSPPVHLSIPTPQPSNLILSPPLVLSTIASTNIRFMIKEIGSVLKKLSNITSISRNQHSCLKCFIIPYCFELVVFLNVDMWDDLNCNMDVFWVSCSSHRKQSQNLTLHFYKLLVNQFSKYFCFVKIIF